MRIESARVFQQIRQTSGIPKLHLRVEAIRRSMASNATHFAKYFAARLGVSAQGFLVHPSGLEHRKIVSQGIDPSLGLIDRYARKQRRM